ncbi:MAG: hypothetical protein HRT52_13140 [Colwellia sp.]|nr:hypothetical protein [Colwellia sp.]
MDVITELLPPTNLVKSETATKDRKQAKKNRKEKEVAIKNDNTGSVVPMKIKFSDWNSLDRRTGNDRRKQMSKRGRWLESRDKNNRREVELSISMKI